MANSYTGDGRWKGLYSFETGSIGQDDIGANDLTNNGAVSSATYFKEGSYSAQLVRSESDYLSIADGSLDSGFPFKSGTSNDEMCFAFWVRFAGTSVYSWQGIISKFGENSKRTFMLNQYGNQIYLQYGHNSGANSEYLANTYYINSGRWYFIGGHVSADDKEILLMIWDDQTSSWIYTEPVYFPNALSPNLSAPFAVGCYFNSSDAATGFFDGYIDGLVVGTGKVSQHELTQIKDGGFDGSIDGLAFYNIDGEIEYTPAPQLNVSQVIVEVLYKPLDPNQHVVNGNITIGVTPSSDSTQHFQKAGSVPISVNASAQDYVYQSPGQYVYAGGPIPIQITPSSTRIRIFSKAGSVGIAVTLSGTYSYPTRFYTGTGAIITIVPSGTARMPVEGWDADSGYGLIDLTDLYQPPPFYVEESDLSFTINPAAQSYAVYALIAHEAEGGVFVGGYGVTQITKPGTYSYVGERGAKVGGEAFLQVVYPKTILEEGLGGVTVSGTPTVKFVGEVTVPPVYVIVGKKGVVVSGKPEVTITTPAEKDYVHEATGGVKVGGAIRYPEVVVVRPREKDVLIVVVGRGGVEVGSDSCLAVIVPPIIVVQPREVSVVVFGAGGSIVIRPITYEEAAEGGVDVGEDPGAQEAETWVMTGVAKEPSFYTNFPFNSYAEDGLRVLAAGEDGIYELGGADDAGRTIHTGARLSSNFGRDVKKRLRSIYCADSGPLTEVRVESEGKVCYAPWDRDRFSVDNNVQGREITIDVAEFDELSHFEVTPMEITR